MRKGPPNLALNAVLNSIRSILSIVFPLITYPYVTRLLQAENLGKVNFASSSISYFSLIAVLGITTYAAREGVQYRNDRKKLNQFSSELFTLNLVTTGASLILLVITCLFVPKFHNYAGLLAIYGSTIAFSVVGVEWLYVVEEDYLYITLRSILVQILSVVLMFVLVKKSTDFYIYAAINAFSSVGSSIFNFIHSKKYVDLRICKDLKKVFRHLKACLVFFSSSIASSIYSNIDITMLGFFSTDYHIGMYSVAVKIYVMIKTVLGAITSVMIPRLTYYRSHDMQEQFNGLLSNLFKLMVTFILPVVFGVILVAEELIAVICGQGYSEAVLSLQILALAIFFAMFATVINGCVLLPCKQEKHALKTTVSAAVVNLVTNFAAIPLFQQNGAAATTVLSETVVMLVGWKYARHLIKLEKMTHVILTSLVGCGVITMVCILADRVIVNPFWLLLFKVMFSVCAYIIVLAILRNEIIMSALEKITVRTEKT